ncbi:cyclin-domain-containing protein [Lentinula edodes]|nr:cyclin-domain-containing protein [Lentinula edodes]
MLALVHPFNPSPDTPHRNTTSSRSRTPHHRKPTPHSARETSSSSFPTTSLHSSSMFSAPKSVTTSRLSSSTQPFVHRQPPTSNSEFASVTTPEHLQPPPTVAPGEIETPAAQTSFDIHSYPPHDLLRLLASLLTQIASTNDKLDAASSSSTLLSSSSTSSELHNVVWRSLTTASRSALSTPSSTLTFHARNIPTISLESYLLRILKYCPTTNEVFLSLLVYFDRMTKLTSEATGRSFVIDSYNIHRLVIAGVTVASKFFSDVFYTNSRYAKVGGLPLAELNQLELQFLLLNNFNLVIPKDEMQRYAEQLILFSSNKSPSPGVSFSSSITPRPTATSTTAPLQSNDMVPMRCMGAIDAYGGPIPGGESPASSSLPPPTNIPFSQSGTSMSRQGARPGVESNALSRIINPSQHQPHHALNGLVNGNGFSSSLRMQHQEDSESEGAETETETETEAETETDGGWTTDDEPTIRPPKSSAGSSSSSSRSSSASDALSICSSVSENDSVEGDDEREDHVMSDIDDDEEGGRTPEHSAQAETPKDGEKTPERKPFQGLLGMSKITPPGRREHEAMDSP